jgi:hypothetical protein
MKNTLYKTLAYIFYFVGDLLWRIPTGFTYNLYQKSMQLSIKFDEKINFQIWKQPSK